MIDLFEKDTPPESVFVPKTEHIDKISLSLMLNAFHGDANIDLIMHMDRAVDKGDPEKIAKDSYQTLKDRLKGGLDARKEKADVI